MKVKKTSVPAFRPGASFKELVAAGRVPKATKAAAPAKKGRRDQGRSGQGREGGQDHGGEEGRSGEEGDPGRVVLDPQHHHRSHRRQEGAGPYRPLSAPPDARLVAHEVGASTRDGGRPDSAFRPKPVANPAGRPP